VKLINHWHHGSLISIQLVHLRMISNTLGNDYWLCDKLHLLSIRGSQLDRLLRAVDVYLVFTQSVHSKNDINAL
jgi:hypothetical protein